MGKKGDGNGGQPRSVEAAGGAAHGSVAKENAHVRGEKPRKWGSPGSGGGGGAKSGKPLFVKGGGVGAKGKALHGEPRAVTDKANGAGQQPPAGKRRLEKRPAGAGKSWKKNLAGGPPGASPEEERAAAGQGAGPTSNWEALRAQMGDGKGKKKRRAAADADDLAATRANRGPGAVGDERGLTRVLALDCEMVGVGPARKSALAHVVVVNNSGHTVYESYCRPAGKVTDFRTKYSGVTPANLRGAPSFR